MPSPGTWVRGGVWTAGLAGVLGRDHEGHLTNAAGLGDFVECPEQVASQLLDIDEVVEHGVGEVHQVVQVDGVALGPPEGHVEGSRLTCQQRRGGSEATLGTRMHPQVLKCFSPPPFSKACSQDTVPG